MPASFPRGSELWGPQTLPLGPNWVGKQPGSTFTNKPSCVSCTKPRGGEGRRARSWSPASATLQVGPDYMRPYLPKKLGSVSCLWTKLESSVTAPVTMPACLPCSPMKLMDSYPSESGGTLIDCVESQVRCWSFEQLGLTVETPGSDQMHFVSQYGHKSVGVGERGMVA